MSEIEIRRHCVSQEQHVKHAWEYSGMSLLNETFSPTRKQSSPNKLLNSGNLYGLISECIANQNRIMDYLSKSNQQTPQMPQPQQYMFSPPQQMFSPPPQMFPQYPPNPYMMTPPNYQHNSFSHVQQSVFQTPTQNHLQTQQQNIQQPPTSDNITRSTIGGFSAKEIDNIKHQSKSGSIGNFALNLFKNLFDYSEYSDKSKNVNGVSGKQRLDVDRMQRVKTVVFHRFDVPESDKPKA